MTEANRNWIKWIVRAALCLSVCTVACAQPDSAAPHTPHAIQIQSPQTGSLSGRLTDLHSAPLAGIQVVLRNQATGAAVLATTAKNGAFRFASLDAGEYTLEAEAPQLGQGRIEGILVTGGTEARVQAAIRFEPPPPALLEAAAPNQIVAPFATQIPMPLTASALPAPAPSAAHPVPIMASPLLSAVLAPVLSRPALSTLSPAQPALIAAEPLRSMPSGALRVEEIVRPPEQSAAPARILPPPEAPLATNIAPPQAPPLSTPQPATYTPVPAQRAALETQSAVILPALALALPHTLPLPAFFAPDLSASAAVAHGAQTLFELKLPHPAPILAAVERVDPVTPVVATTVTATQLQALPASGRRWQEFLFDTPAASASANSSQTQESAEATIDGAIMRLAFGVAAGSGSRVSDPSGEGAGQQMPMSKLGDQAWTGGRELNVSEAAIHEVTTVAGNVEAEGLRSAGGRTTIHTESGGDTFHGQAFLFDRQNTWGAQNPFTQLEQFTGFSGGPLQGYTSNYVSPSYTPPDHEIVWGLGAGSRIQRDKLFWFAALDSYHRNDPGLAAAKEPFGTDEAVGTAGYGDCYGFFCPPSTAQIDLLCSQQGLSVPSPSGGASSCPVAQVMADYSQMLEALDGELGPAPRRSAQWVGFGRIDWQATERHRFTLEGTGANWNSPGGGLTKVEESYGSHSFGSSQASEEWLLARWEAYLTANLLAVTQGSAGRTILSARPDTPSAFEQAFLNGNSWGQLPEIVVDSANGFTIGNPSRFGHGSYPDERLYHGQEMVDWVHNRLLVKAGFELDHNADVTSLLRNQTGTYHYSHVANFISDALAFENFGLNPSTYQNPHSCDPTGKAWTTTTGTLMGLGALPCYSSYSQTIGSSNWHLSTNDWAGYVTAQWQPHRLAVFSAGLRWEREQLPPPIAALANPALTIPTQTNPTLLFSADLPHLGNNWGPRLSLAIGNAQGRWPVLRLGYGMYYGRTQNATIETALTQTGSFNGDLNYFIRPTDGLNPMTLASGAPQFPDVLTGPPASVVTPGATGFAPNFHNPEIHQAVAAIEQSLPGRVELTASAMLSLGRRLPVFMDANLGPLTSTETITYAVCDEVPYTPPGATSSGQSGNTGGRCGNLGLGPIKAATITVPLYASWPFADCSSGSQLNSAGQCGWINPNYQQITQIASRANSAYEAAIVKITRYGHRGLSLHAHYTYAHAMDWNPNQSPLDPADFSKEYGTSSLDVRHSAAALVIYEAPWKLRGFAGNMVNGWMVSGIGQFHSGLPYTMRTSGSLPDEFDSSGNGIVGLGPGMNGSGGDNRIYGLGSDGNYYSIGRNTFRYPDTWKADMRLAKRFNLGEVRQLEIMAESFNLFNHQNVTEIETTGYTIEAGSPPSALGTPATLPALTFLTGLKISARTGLPIPAFGQPLNINGTDFYRERQIQLGLRMRF